MRGRILLAATACACLLGGCKSDSTAIEEGLDVTGTWDGTLTATIQGGGSSRAILEMTLSQSGSAVSGMFSDTTGTGTVSGTLAGPVLHLAWHTNDNSADCAPFSLVTDFDVTTSRMTLRSASGRLCDSGEGPMVVTGGSGSLSRR